ncbi:MFS transporter [bacterium M00.F.Ca.ET.228.01.1.1]|uniref:MFS transporter n=1 Tax=Paraburkholderia phenoliruptrix TaxID=252970 RepID=UPI00109271F1|nr:MFS transporter [Paraburkholderia phenoliruptrix]TGP41486.1 MFS transporter [bacterium M00.F.Ca.ET.228.01.1.1]TGR98143.1 MFS transporter [bacterium M00.F.Ca.ET.191.01.1.1]TGU02334.1 MFS transporter [bacterium M00.F.Ca.ET.155.01.1.1]MBW0447134.1 MFS transporter [Paraburkholderia phenoliruptrix]MBW9101483.1 MFS transporter [Paraburkholderia phenoliruptrix]
MKTPSPSFAPPAATPREFATSTLLALVVFAAITPLLLLVAPAVATQLGGQLGLSASQIGTYFFVELGAFSCATLPSLLWLGRVDARRVARVATAVFCIGNIATALLMPGFVALLVMRTLTALGGGTLMVLCMTSAATSGNRDRVYGLWVVGQLVAGALGLFVLPHLFDAFGLRALYVALAVLALLASPLTRGFDPALGSASGQTARKMERHTNTGHAWLLATLVTAGVLAFYVAIGGVWTFASKAAALAGLDAGRTGELLAVASVMGIVGAACASFIGNRIARAAMLLTGYAILVVALLGLSAHPGGIGYSAAIFGFKFAWTFVLPFILAAAARTDQSGRLIATLNFVIGAGLAVGPLIAGVLLDAGASLSTLFQGAAAICGLSFACLLRVERSGHDASHTSSLSNPHS